MPFQELHSSLKPIGRHAKTKPALALIPGTFNTEIPGYSIKFAEKYGEDDNLLKDVHIYYDLNKGANANVKVIKAEKERLQLKKEVSI